MIYLSFCQLFYAMYFDMKYLFIFTMYFFVQNKKCDCSPKELVTARAKYYGLVKKYLIQIQLLENYPIEKRSMIKDTNVEKFYK